jgi:4-amino-4-deoxy-L-arabinose transferase-like glycosyltransferase
LFLLFLSIVYPQNTIDSLYNHLARIGHWLQQGSLKPYEGFSEFGSVYPGNKSIVMAWFILFLKSDSLVGSIQWLSALLISLGIFGISIELGFSSVKAAISSTIFLTFPIVILESMTAQNDLFLAMLFIVGVYLFIAGINKNRGFLLTFSSLSLSLAIGTKQLIIFAIPGFIILFVYLVMIKRNLIKLSLRFFIIPLTIFSICFGSFFYVQNLIYFGNPVGVQDATLTDRSKESTLVMAEYSLARLSSQFISCEGLPSNFEDSCLLVKGKFFSKIYSNPSFNLESTNGLLDKKCGNNCFSFTKKYPLNEDSAWFGILSWILIIPSCIIIIISTIKNKNPLPLIFLFTSLLYFVLPYFTIWTWGIYMGRYFILSTALIMPFTGYLFSTTKWWNKLITIIFILCSLNVLTYTTISNDSKPLITKQIMVEVQKWGKEHSIFITKIAYKLTPLFEEKNSYIDYSGKDLVVLETNNPNVPYTPSVLVRKYVPDNSEIGIIDKPEMFYDYLLYKKSFTRKIYEFVFNGEQYPILEKIKDVSPKYLLIRTDIPLDIPADYHKIKKMDVWILYCR